MATHYVFKIKGKGKKKKKAEAARKADDGSRAEFGRNHQSENCRKPRSVTADQLTTQRK